MGVVPLSPSPHEHLPIDKIQALAASLDDPGDHSDASDIPYDEGCHSRWSPESPQYFPDYAGSDSDSSDFESDFSDQDEEPCPPWLPPCLPGKFGPPTNFHNNIFKEELLINVQLKL